jgi:hypothetical protein
MRERLGTDADASIFASLAQAAQQQQQALAHTNHVMALCVAVITNRDKLLDEKTATNESVEIVERAEKVVATWLRTIKGTGDLAEINQEDADA